VLTPNPKTSGRVRSGPFNGGLGYALKKHNSTTIRGQWQRFVTRVYKNVPVLDSGARVKDDVRWSRGQGDVLLVERNEEIGRPRSGQLN